MNCYKLVLLTLIGCCFVESDGSKVSVPTYFYIGLDKVTWNEAIRLCESINMRIVSLQTKSKYDLLYNWIIANGVPFDTVDKAVWVSLNRIPDQNQSTWDWYWISGEPLSYVQWLPGEPNNNAGNEQCNLALTYNKTVVVGDVRCSNTYWPVCEKIPEKCGCKTQNGNNNNGQGQCPTLTVNVNNCE